MILKPNKTELSSLNTQVTNTPFAPDAQSDAPDATEAPRPGRPRSPEKSEAICDAAACLFLAQGVAGTSMDAVAQAAGVSKQTVYARFRSKEDLFKEVIRQKMVDYQLTLEEFPVRRPLREALQAIGRRFVDLLFDEQVVSMFRVVISESVRQPQVARLFYESGPGQTMGAMEAFLKQRVADGQVEIEDCQYAASTFFLMLKGQQHMALMLNLPIQMDDAARDRHVERAVDAFLTLFG